MVADGPSVASQAGVGVAVVGDDEIGSMEQGEFWLFMLILVAIGGVFSMNIVRMFYNARNFHVADRVIDEYNLERDDPETRALVENHKLFETGYARVLLPRGA